MKWLRVYISCVLFIPVVANAHGMAVIETVFVNAWVIFVVDLIFFVMLLFCKSIIVPLFYLLSLLVMFFLFYYYLGCLHGNYIIDIYFYIAGYFFLVVMPLFLTFVFVRFGNV